MSMKKGKVISMPSSVEAQIRTRARNLPIDRCYINEDWEMAQMANIVVTRKHVNGNITFGFYLVDLMLLGVKDCFYEFNSPSAELEEQLDNAPDIFIECDYELAHNIIYAGTAFAEKYGFKPVKEFKTGIYILEEDSDAIPQMDIPLGDDGVPIVYIDSENNMQREIAILEKTAGPGNYIVFDEDEDDDWDDDLDEDDDDDWDDDLDDDEDDDSNWNYEEIVDEVLEMGVENFLNEYKDLTPIQRMAVTDVAFEIIFSSFGIEVHETFELINSDERFDPFLERLPELEKYLDQLQSIIDKTAGNKLSALPEIEALIADHPDVPELSILQISLLFDLNMKQEAEQLVLDWYDRAPDHYAIRLLYARWLVEQKRFDEMFELFGNLPGLNALSTENLPFTEIMVAEFCACYVLAWLSKNNIEKAEPYYQMLLELEYMTPIIKDALIAMVDKKSEALRKKIPELNLED